MTQAEEEVSTIQDMIKEAHRLGEISENDKDEDLDRYGRAVAEVDSYPVQTLRGFAEKLRFSYDDTHSTLISGIYQDVFRLAKQAH